MCEQSGLSHETGKGIMRVGEEDRVECNWQQSQVEVPGRRNGNIGEHQDGEDHGNREASINNVWKRHNKGHYFVC